MFSRLYVRNYVLIDSLEIEFPEGLVIITGQTGAGKSIIIGSISLLLGAKADSSVIGESGESCIVEAEFDASPLEHRLRAAVEDCGAEWDGGRLVLRRVVARSGRSRSFVNDCPASLAALSSIASSLIDIHSQHQTLLLGDRGFRLSVLDHFAGNSSLLDSMSAAYADYTAAKAELEDIQGRISKMEAERDYDQARLSKLEAAALREGELEELEAEQKRLANAEEIKEGLFAVEELLSPGSDEAVSVDEALRESERRLAKAAQFVPRLAGLGERMASARVELDDILDDVRRVNAGIEVSARRLEEVDARISQIYDLLHYFSCGDVAGLIAEREALAGSLHDSAELILRREELRGEVASKLAAAETLAAELHGRRQKAAGPLASEVEKSLRYLELQYAVFGVEVQSAPLGPTGVDAVSFSFSASGRNAVDAAKCASGGEMSRIMLCLKDIMARYTDMPTMIFDEIDTGVSGSAADRMGSMICSMGDNMQVFAITHLPQVAAKGKAHYVVTKDIDPASSKSVTRIAKLSDRERVMEVARMLSGSTVTPEAVANAESLLAQ